METKSCWIHTDEANAGTGMTTRRQQRGEEDKQVKAAGDFCRFPLFFCVCFFPLPLPPLREMKAGIIRKWSVLVGGLISTRAAGGSCVCSRWLWGSEAELASYASPRDPSYR